MNFERRGKKTGALIAAVIFCAAAGFAHAENNKAQPKLETKTLTIQKADGTAAITAELARTDEQKMRGLMFRKTLPDGEGMLFVYTRDERMSFWMKNTLIALSIAYISRDGLIVDIFDMRPQSIIPVRSTRAVRYALEVPQGWFARAGIAEGSRVLGLPE
ncbi:MAG: DUF192 domain-containing protein [Spirochaetaceae bacterium]|jgi:uncharacterized membrane protein (UPF0127 family)|nr:DUF192 domain-containing protein [Spirochaetaceae bacterium]